MALTTCPVCSNSPTIPTVRREYIATMQNRVYNTRLEAHQASRGNLQLNICAHCGFAYNATFNETLLKYDSIYDNSVPSVVMTNYYKDIAAYLHEKYHVGNNLVIDIGCGKGMFLKVAAQLFPTMRGLGVDPSYESDRDENPPSNLKFVPSIFSADQITECPALVVCRHVLEHIHQPVDFLKSIQLALALFPGVPFFLEVPDLLWILNNRTFWDFCYEHCNYFTPESLSHTLSLSGFTPQLIQNAFGGQYLWVEAINAPFAVHPNPVAPTTAAIATTVTILSEYALLEANQIASTRQLLLHLKQSGKALAVWGMATKGILLALLLDPQRTLLDFCIDMNSNKQGCFIPVTGHEIQAPETLSILTSTPLVIVVMNPNYLEEIRMYCRQKLNIEPQFIDAQGRQL